MTKHKIFFVILSLLASQAIALDRIEQTYPELKTFFESADFQKVAKNIVFKVVDSEASPSAFTTLLVDEGGNFTKVICIHQKLFNLLTSDELKFVICHELGHCNDPKLFRTIFAPIGFICAQNLTACILVTKDLCQGKLLHGIRKILVTCGLTAVEYLYALKLSRDGENWADAFAIKMTKDLSAAITVLHKRKQFASKTSRWSNDLLEDHPNEEARIANITKVYLQLPLNITTLVQ